jgi:hypothetical protein
MTSQLPPPSQQWSHSTITMEKLNMALGDQSITAIEADILMGRTKTDNTEGPNATEPPLVPIMSHPPEYAGDLSAKTFLDVTTSCPSLPNHRKLRKHLKLDFKDLDSVQHTLNILQALAPESAGNCIFLNADIIAGPGRTSDDVVVPAKDFLETCLTFIAKQKDKSIAFSLGFKVDVVSIVGHSHGELAAMADLVDAYNLSQKSAGLVLAISARLLSKHYAPFDIFLRQYPACQLLVWTGSGEPPISSRKAANIRRHFEHQGTLARVGFDCQVSVDLNCCSMNLNVPNRLLIAFTFVDSLLPLPALPSLFGFTIRYCDVLHWPFQVCTDGAASSCSANKTKGRLVHELSIELSSFLILFARIHKGSKKKCSNTGQLSLLAENLGILECENRSRKL